MGDSYSATLTIKGWPLLGVTFREHRQGERLITREEERIRPGYLGELGELLRGFDPPREEKAAALDTLEIELGQAGLEQYAEGLSWEPAGTLLCPVCRHEGEIEAFGVSREASYLAEPLCPAACRYRGPLALFQHGEIAITSEQNCGLLALEPVRSALQAAGFAYSGHDDGGYGFPGQLAEWEPGQPGERLGAFSSEAGKMLTLSDWTAILNAAPSLAEAAKRVSDYFDLPRLEDRGVAEALGERE